MAKRPSHTAAPQQARKGARKGAKKGRQAGIQTGIQSGTGTDARAGRHNQPKIKAPHHRHTAETRAETSGQSWTPESGGTSPPRALPKQLTGTIQPVSLLTLSGWPDYALLDSGHGQKLEQYGSIRLVRPEAQAIWAPRLGADDWRAANAVFTGNTEEEGPGRWELKEAGLGPWKMCFDPVRFICKFTSFRHTGVFPEQAAHWTWLAKRVSNAVARGRTPKVLNLFGYTGVASLVAAAAGASVTHVDASKKTIAWAKQNQEASHLPGNSVRWLVDDAVKFVEREERRGAGYDGIIVDPPKYGRGPKSEIWHLHADLPRLLKSLDAILKPDADFMILSAYSIRSSFLMLDELVRDVMQARLGRGGLLEAGELVLEELPMAGLRSRRLSTSLFCRYRFDG